MKKRKATKVVFKEMNQWKREILHEAERLIDKLLKLELSRTHLLFEFKHEEKISTITWWFISDDIVCQNTTIEEEK